MADRVQWHQELTYRTGGNDTFAVVEDTPKCDPNPRPQCDHICLGEYGHDGPHFYGYRSGTPVDEINRLIDEIERLRELVTQLETERDMWERHAQRSS